MDKLVAKVSKRKIDPRSIGENVTMEEKKKKKGGKKENPIKVVHFTDPIRIIATADEFKRRVQELTGRSSKVADMLFVQETEESVSEASTHLCSSQEQGGCCGDLGLPSDLGFDDVGDCGLSDVWGLAPDDDASAWLAEFM